MKSYKTGLCEGNIPCGSAVMLQSSWEKYFCKPEEASSKGAEKYVLFSDSQQPGGIFPYQEMEGFFAYPTVKHLLGVISETFQGVWITHLSQISGYDGALRSYLFNALSNYRGIQALTKVRSREAASLEASPIAEQALLFFIGYSCRVKLRMGNHKLPQSSSIAFLSQIARDGFNRGVLPG